MAAPQGCAPALYDIMLECWHKVNLTANYLVSLFCYATGVNAAACQNFHLLNFVQDPMKRPTFETLQWKLEDFFTMSDSEYKEASAY